MMKRILVCTCLLVLPILALSQVNYLNDMIISSIHNVVDHENSFLLQQAKPPLSQIWICKDGLPRDFPYESINSVVFFSLDNRANLPWSLRKQLKRGVRSFYVQPQVLNNGRIVIVISVRITHRRRVELSDWGVFTYSYSPIEGRWLLETTEYGGI